MYSLERHDFEEILKLVHFCMTHIKTGSINPKDLLEEMLKVFRSYDAVFFPSNPEMNGVDLTKSFGLKEGPRDITKYLDHYWRMDPLFAAQFSPEPTNLVFKTDDVISYPKLKKLDYYREYLQHINWFGELVIRVCSENGFWGTMSLSRSQNQPYYDQSDIQKAEFVLPYLIDTFEATMFFSKINGERLAFEQWLESKPEGVILLDTKLNPIFFNSNAKKLCEPLAVQKHEVVPSALSNDIILPNSIVTDCRNLVEQQDSKSCFSNNRIINTKDGGKYYIKYTLVNQPCKNIILPYFIVNINDLTKSDDEPGVVLIKDFGLSDREQKIAQYTGLGLTNKEIGKKMGISPFTVQSHLRNIFEKMGIKRRSQLANLIK